MKNKTMCISESNSQCQNEELKKMKVKKTFRIKNDKGLHTRPATELVKCASSYRSQIFLNYQNLSVNAKSLLGILMLAASRGAKITVTAEGVDAQEAVTAIVYLANTKFNIKY